MLLWFLKLCCSKGNEQKPLPPFCNDLFSRFEQQTSILEKTGKDNGPHDGPSQGLVSKHLENLKLDTENRLSKLRNEMEGRTVTGVTDRHRCDGPSQTIQRNWVCELCDGAAGRTVAGATGRHRLHNPSLGRISLYILRDVLDYSYFNYKVRGLMLISLITWGLKEVTLS